MWIGISEVDGQVSLWTKTVHKYGLVVCCKSVSEQLYQQQHSLFIGYETVRSNKHLNMESLTRDCIFYWFYRYIFKHLNVLTSIFSTVLSKWLLIFLRISELRMPQIRVFILKGIALLPCLNHLQIHISIVFVTTQWDVPMLEEIDISFLYTSH